MSSLLFACKDGNTKECISKKQFKCDGIKNCPNGDDENGCPAPTPIPSTSTSTTTPATTSTTKKSTTTKTTSTTTKSTSTTTKSTSTTTKSTSTTTKSTSTTAKSSSTTNKSPSTTAKPSSTTPIPTPSHKGLSGWVIALIVLLSLAIVIPGAILAIKFIRRRQLNEYRLLNE